MDYLTEALEFFEQLVLEFDPLIMVYSCWKAVPQDKVTFEIFFYCSSGFIGSGLGLGETSHQFINYA